LRVPPHGSEASRQQGTRQVEKAGEAVREYFEQWYFGYSGELAEWLMASVLKTDVPERVSGVRIPRSPPNIDPQASNRIFEFDIKSIK
jgi:hypothetical protein